MSRDLQYLLKEIDELYYDIVIEVRAVFPFPRDSYVGKTAIETPGFYRREGSGHYTLVFDQPLTHRDIARLRKLAYWLNQNSLIRLYDLLDCWKVVGSNTRIRKDYEGHQELDILRRLRHLFSHAGSFDESNCKHSMLLSRIMEHFKPHSRVSHLPGEFPLQIDEVVKVIFEKVKKYVNCLLQERRKQPDIFP